MKKRIITGIVLALIFVPLVFLGGLFFEIGVACLSVIAFNELFTLIEKNNKIPFLVKALSFLSVPILSICLDALLPCIGIIIMFLFIPIIFFSEEEYNYDIALKLFGTVIFIGLLFYNLVYIRLSSFDEFIYLLLITIFTDTFALIGGKIFGKHKLNQRISPNKTIEGSLIGLIVGTIIPSIYYLYIVDQSMSIILIIIMTAIFSIVGQIGDLLFSAIKRNNKIKDFSNLFPGHGGVLDRFDSLLIVGVIYLIVKILFL